MTTYNLLVEGDVTAVDTSTSLTSQGSVSAPSRRVPKDISLIKDIVVSIVGDHAAAGAAVLALRFGGQAVADGEQVIVVGAAGGQAVQAGSDSAAQVSPPLVLKDIDIKVKEGEQLDVQAEMDGTDIGTVRAVVQVVYG